jgi:hypothetical protein
MQNIIKKLRFKGEGFVINAPKDLAESFVELGFKTKFNQGKCSNSLVFVENREGLVNFLSKELIYIEFDSVFWISYPKGTSTVKSDINRDSIRITVEEFGLTTVTAISIDETWSALRFRPIDKVGE